MRGDETDLRGRENGGMEGPAMLGVWMYRVGSCGWSFSGNWVLGERRLGNYTTLSAFLRYGHSRGGHYSFLHAPSISPTLQHLEHHHPTNLPIHNLVTLTHLNIIPSRKQETHNTTPPPFPIPCTSHPHLIHLSKKQPVRDCVLLSARMCFSWHSKCSLCYFPRFAT